MFEISPSHLAACFQDNCFLCTTGIDSCWCHHPWWWHIYFLHSVRPCTLFSCFFCCGLLARNLSLRIWAIFICATWFSFLTLLLLNRWTFTLVTIYFGVKAAYVYLVVLHVERNWATLCVLQYVTFVLEEATKHPLGLALFIQNLQSHTAWIITYEKNPFQIDSLKVWILTKTAP